MCKPDKKPSLRDRYLIRRYENEEEEKNETETSHVYVCY